MLIISIVSEEVAVSNLTCVLLIAHVYWLVYKIYTVSQN